MDDLKLLQRSRNALPDPLPGAQERGRSALEARMSEAASAPVTDIRSRRRRVGTIAAGIAAVAASVLVLANIAGVTGPGGASAQATEVLESAALAAIGAEDLVVADGQYLLVETDSEYMMSASTDEANPVGNEIGVAYPEHWEVYIPSDSDEQASWVREYGDPTRFYGDGAREYAATMSVRDTEIQRGVAGKLHNVLGEKLLAELPRDGAALFAYYDAEYTGGSASREEDTFGRITDMLRAGNVPSDLRAAGYEALTMIEGVEVTEEVANLHGQSGIAIGRHEPSRDYRHDIIIDPETGRFIGERELAVRDAHAVPAGEMWSWTAIMTSVVDAAP
jgi:hypothetical protein